MDSYRIPTKSGASEYVDKRSRFLGLVRPVGSEDEARTIIAACKKQYHDARHNCWCYLLRDGTERYSDDGEPQGTAGIPMLEVFRRAGVTNVVCVVTRYFGGVLLGTGGLLRAYTAAAADALADAGISEVRRWLACEVSTPYALYEPVRAAVAALGDAVCRRRDGLRPAAGGSRRDLCRAGARPDRRPLRRAPRRRDGARRPSRRFRPVSGGCGSTYARRTPEYRRI